MSEDIIKVKNLVKEFGQFQAVKGINFNVKAGEIFAFLGPNGAGKTTTIKILTTLLSPTKGEVYLDGHDISKEQNEARQSFGIVFQDPSLDDELTTYENMDFGGILYGVPADLRKERIEELLKFVDLWDRKDSLVKTFSGGMRRRLELARGLIHSPRILFLDEPTTGLDPQTRHHIWEYLQNLQKQRKLTIFFTTHYMEEAANAANTIAVIDHGQIITIDSLSGLLKKTKKKTLEDAFLSLTGNDIREESAGAVDAMRMHRQAWRGRR